MQISLKDDLNSLEQNYSYLLTGGQNLSQFLCGGLTKFEEAFFQISILCQKIPISPHPNIQLT